MSAWTLGWDVWAGAMLRASWQGGAALVLAWGLGEVLARGVPRVRCWLWRLAYLKFAACLVILAPLSLALLPAERIEAGKAGGRGAGAVVPEEAVPAGPGLVEAPAVEAVGSTRVVPSALSRL